MTAQSQYLKMSRMPKFLATELALKPGGVVVDHGMISQAVRAGERLPAYIATERFNP